MDGGIAPRAPVPTAHPRHADRTLSGVGATGLTAASTVLLFICLVGRFVWVYKKEEAAASRLGSPASPPVVRAIVVQRAVPPSLLPVFVHASDRGAPEYECCAVCLSEFGEREAGRLLPGCGHAFHEACIATWLQVNTTCPLCRAAVAY